MNDIMKNMICNTRNFSGFEKRKKEISRLSIMDQKQLPI